MTNGEVPRRVLGVLVRIPPERRRAVLEDVTDMSSPRASFWIMVGISTIIAAYGLLANSTAVVIGAMLVAPLMGPIFGVALALLRGDRRLLTHALIAEGSGVALSVMLGGLIGLVPLRPNFASEILARTQPTIYDLIIALASGLAGAYALIDEKLSPTLPGVAMATAIVPPLATCGLSMAAGRWDWAFGAFLLFLGNFLAIETAAAVVFGVFRLEGGGARDALTVAQFFRRFGVSVIALLVVGVFMTHTLVTLIADRRFSVAMRDAVADEVGATVGARVSQVTIDRHGRTIDVLATVLTPQGFGPTQVARIEDVLRARVDPAIHLIVRSVISRDEDRIGPVFIPEAQLAREKAAATHAQFLTTITDALQRGLKAVQGARLVDVGREDEHQQPVIRAVVQTPTAIDPTQVAGIEQTLQAAVSMPVHLIISSVLVRDADAHGYLYATQGAPAPLTGEALVVHQRLDRALLDQLTRVPGAVLLDFRYTRQNDRLRVLAVVRAPRIIQPGEVRTIENAFRKYVDPTTDLIVRASVGADVSAAGFVSEVDEGSLAIRSGRR